MRKPHEFLSAIRAGIPIEWHRLLNVMSKNDIPPGTLILCLAPESRLTQRTQVRIVDESLFTDIESQFPSPTPITDRVSASHTGKSHSQSVEGNALMIQYHPWQKPEVAVSWDGRRWSPPPPENTSLVIVENLQNFLRYRETLDLITADCDIEDQPEQLILAFGAGNAAAKVCNLSYYRQFRNVYTLFDLDMGGVKTYANLKSLLGPADMTPRFLAPRNFEQYLERSQWHLTQDERSAVYLARGKHPELAPLLTCMYTKGKKLEQETYLERIHG